MSFFNELKPLVIRHIKYGVRSEYMKPFGLVLMRTLENTLGESFSSEAEHAWKSVWTRCSSVVSRSLSVGTNLITVSIVNGDIGQLKTAVSCAPRCERIQWLTRVEVPGLSNRNIAPHTIRLTRVEVPDLSNRNIAPHTIRITRVEVS